MPLTLLSLDKKNGEKTRTKGIEETRGKGAKGQKRNKKGQKGQEYTK
jgi:hypothetical protein